MHEHCTIYAVYGAVVIRCCRNKSRNKINGTMVKRITHKMSGGCSTPELSPAPNTDGDSRPGFLTVGSITSVHVPVRATTMFACICAEYSRKRKKYALVKLLVCVTRVAACHKRETYVGRETCRWKCKGTHGTGGRRDRSPHSSGITNKLNWRE